MGPDFVAVHGYYHVYCVTAKFVLHSHNYSGKDFALIHRFQSLRLAHISMHKLHTLLLLAAIALLSGCTSLTPLVSKPPYSKITVNRPFSWGDGILTIKLNMPTGDYSPLFEDKGGYFYQAPQKLTGRDAWMPLMLDGGLYLERNVTRPEMIYFVQAQQGVPGKINIGNRADVTLHP